MPPQPMAGEEWSLPMPKAEMMTRLKLGWRSFETFARAYGIKPLGRQLFQIRLDQMDSATRRRIESGR